jgi:hypothetical protein
MEKDNDEYRLTCMEVEVDIMKSDMKKIMENHLPHINQAIVRLDTSMKIYGGLIIAGITALIILGLTP